jgi:Co/Zn/Cd efflux system component
MILISLFALAGNGASLIILNKSKDNEAHIQASKIFTSNDVIANIGVILAGIVVYLTDSRYPDLIIGAIVFWLVLRGAIRILKL